MRIRLVTVGLGVAAAACAAPPSPEARLLARVPADASAVIAIDPARVRGTWIDRGAEVYAAGVPACVRARARAAERVVLAWWADGWTLLLAGGEASAPGCDGLTIERGLAWAGEAPEAAGGPGWFARGERRARWRALGGAAPVRAVADLALSPGIVGRVAATLSAADGVDARVVVRFDERDAATGAIERLERWRGELDRAWLGGAWPLFAGLAAKVEPGDPTRVTANLRVPGSAGSDAALLAIAAARGGLAPRRSAPCPVIGDPWAGRITCLGPGRFELDPALRDELLRDPGPFARDARVVPWSQGGQTVGLKLYAIRPGSLLAALGLVNGDAIRTVNGVALTGLDQALAVYQRAQHDDRITVELERRGDPITLIYEIR